MPVIGGHRADGYPSRGTATSAQLAGGLLETVLCRDGALVRLAEHLARLDQSARELYGPELPAGAAARAVVAARTAPAGRAVLRLILDATAR
ncbi:MAG: hypothetical protein ACRDNZ_23140, partial [Streptosporangiaceae bacterium]